MWIYLTLLAVQVLAYSIIGSKLLINLIDKKKKEAKKNLKRGLILFLFSGFFFSILPGSNIFWWPFNRINELTYTNSILGKPIHLGTPVYEFESNPTFNGDGFSYAEYKLSENNASYFKSPKDNFFTDYPKKGIRDDWQIRTWTTTPLKETDQNAFNFISVYDMYSDYKVDSHYNLEEILKEEGNIYSYRYYLHRDQHFGNIDFYIISPNKRLIILINHNT